MAGRNAKTAKPAKPAKKSKTKPKPKPKPKPKHLKGAKAVDKVTSTAKKLSKSVKKTTQKKFSKSELEIVAELKHLADYIYDAKVEIGLIRPDDVKHDLLPSAKDELDAVVEAAADATNAIMDSCEIIEDVMAGLPAQSSDKLMDATTRIYEACTFQDITGQRINKVVKTMHHIENRIDALMAAFGEEVAKSKPQEKAKQGQADEPSMDEGLLEGPQLADLAKNQSEIDDLLASFD